MKPESEVEDRLGELFSGAKTACDGGASTTDFEPAFVRLLEFIDRHPECHDAAERRFVQGLRDGSVCLELLGFCMFSLRWRVVETETRQLLLVDPDPRRMVLSDVLAAFADDWDGAELYAYYSR